MEEILYGLFSGVLGNAEVLVFAWGICQVKLTKDWKRWAAAGVLWAVVMAVAYGGYFGGMVSFPIGMIGKMMIISFLLMQGKVVHRILYYWFSIFFASIAFQPIYFGIMVLWEYVTHDAEAGLIVKNIASVFNICVLVLVSGQIRKRKQWVSWIRSISMKYYLLGLFCSFCAEGLKNYMVLELAGVNLRSKIFWGILTNILYLMLYFLGIGFAFVNLLKERYYRESSLKSEYLRMAQAHYGELAGHMREVRSIRHDMLAHVNAIEHLVQEEKTEEVLEYLHGMQQEIQGTNRKKADVGNELVNAVLEHELGKMDTETAFVSEGCLLDVPGVSDYDLCVIFSNLLSNAVEACKRCSGEIAKTIRLEIKNRQGHLLIGMRNSVEEPVVLERLGHFTSKKDQENHGYGIYNIQKTVEKYGGDIDFEMEGNFFSVKICFYPEN